MKHYFILYTILFFIIGCKKENEKNEQPIVIEKQANIVIGDNFIENISLKENHSGIGLINKIDCNNDLVDDFAFSFTEEFVQGGTLLRLRVLSIQSLTQDAEISTDSMMNPIVYNLSDTLKLDANWSNGKFALYSKKIVGGPFDEISYTISGNWYYIYDAYIGIRLNAKHLGWIKIAVNPKIYIYEWAISK